MPNNGYTILSGCFNYRGATYRYRRAGTRAKGNYTILVEVKVINKWQTAHEYTIGEFKAMYNTATELLEKINKKENGLINANQSKNR